jgi:hypothetical protein
MYCALGRMKGKEECVQNDVEEAVWWPLWKQEEVEGEN